MALKTPDQRALPEGSPTQTREQAWAVVVDNDRLVKFFLKRFLVRVMAGRHELFAYSRQQLFNELLSAAYEAMLIAVEGYDPTKGFALSTYAEKVVWRHLTDELARWRAHTAIDGEREESLEELFDSAWIQDGSEGPRDNLFPRGYPLDGKFYDPQTHLTDRDIDAHMDAVLLVDKVREALSPHEFEVLVLTSQGRTSFEVARMLGVLDSHVRNVLCRARDKARTSLNDRVAAGAAPLRCVPGFEARQVGQPGHLSAAPAGALS